MSHVYSKTRTENIIDSITKQKNSVDFCSYLAVGKKSVLVVTTGPTTAPVLCV